jgi:hypothetical protein
MGIEKDALICMYDEEEIMTPVSHRQPWWARRYQGTIEAELSDGTKIDVQIHKDGLTWFINKLAVHPSNGDSIEGVIREIGIIYNDAVMNWKWL